VDSSWAESMYKLLLHYVQLCGSCGRYRWCLCATNAAGYSVAVFAIVSLFSGLFLRSVLSACVSLILPSIVHNLRVDMTLQWPDVIASMSYTVPPTLSEAFTALKGSPACAMWSWRPECVHARTSWIASR
jgi:hypothetical protein